MGRLKRTLVLDTSSNWLYICFLENDKVVYEVKSEGLNNHSDNLLPLIEEGLKKLKFEVKDFTRIILGYGPGAYTGLRVSMSVAKMFAWTLNIPLYTMSSLDLLTSGYEEEGLYLIKFKAKKGFIYHKAFRIENQSKQIIAKDMFVSEDYLNSYQYEDIKIITNYDVLVDCLKIKEDELTLVTNIHALEPNYLRDC